MKMKVEDGFAGYVSSNETEVKFCEDSMAIGYVSKLDDEGYPSEFRLFDSDELTRLAGKKGSKGKLTVYIVPCSYYGMTTLMTEDAIGVYPTYDLKLIEPESGLNFKLFIHNVSRRELNVNA